MRFFKLQKEILANAYVLAFTLIISQPLTAAAAPKSCSEIINHAFFTPYVYLDSDHRAYIRVTEHKTWLAHATNLFAKHLSPFFGYRHLTEPLKRLDTALSTHDDSKGYYTLMAEAFEMNVNLQWHTNPQYVPASGPLIIIANHPLSGADGIAIAHSLSHIRKDIKIVMTDALKKAPGLQENAFMLQVHGGSSRQAQYRRARHNISIFSSIKKYLKNGGAIVIFPAGEVSSRSDLSQPMAYDKRWQRGLHDIYQSVPNAQILPMYVEGQPTDLFQWVKHHVSESAAGALLISDFMDHVNNPINLHAGLPYKPNALTGMPEDEFLGLLRADVYSLREIKKDE